MGAGVSGRNRLVLVLWSLQTALTWTSGAIGEIRGIIKFQRVKFEVGAVQLVHPTLLRVLTIAAGVLVVLGCGGNVSDGAASRGATQGTGGRTSSDGDSGSTLPAVDAGRDAESGPNCGDECCGLLVPKSCTAHIQVQADMRTPNILLVVDKSGSMNDATSDAGTYSQWALNWKALASTISLQRLRANINFGLDLFPFSAAGIDPSTTDPVQACQVQSGGSAIEIEIDTGADQLNAILNLLNEQNPGGYSPTAKALDAAYSYFTTGNGKGLKGSKSVILVTNGAADCNANLSCGADTCIPNNENSCPPNNGTVNCCVNAGHLCLDDVSVVQAISKLAVAGIGTFVVGRPVSETEANALNYFAQVGGVPNSAGSNGVYYYPITSPDALPELVTALSSLTTQLVTTCDIPLDTSGPIDPSSVRVAIDCNMIALVSSSVYSQPDAGNSEGWYIDNSQNPPHLRLVGEVCSYLELNGARVVDIVLGCPSP